MLQGVLIFLLAIFHVVILIDCAQRQPSYFAGSTSRGVWLAVILLIPLFGPLAYMVAMLGKPGPVA